MQTDDDQPVYVHRRLPKVAPSPPPTQEPEHPRPPLEDFVDRRPIVHYHFHPPSHEDASARRPVRPRGAPVMPRDWVFTWSGLFWIFFTSMLGVGVLGALVYLALIYFGVVEW